MFKYGRLKVRKAKHRNPEVCSFGRVLVPLIVHGHSNPRYRYKIAWNRQQRSILRAKLVWIGINGLIPEGFELHHKDEDRFNDSIDNLELLTDESHSDFHYGENEDEF